MVAEKGLRINRLLIIAVVAGTCLLWAIPGFPETEAGYQVPYIPFDSLPQIDGITIDWERLSSKPQFSHSDFFSIVCPRLYTWTEEGQEKQLLVPWASHGPDGKRLRCGVAEENQQLQLRLGWNAQTNRLYVAARVTDDYHVTTSNTSDLRLAWRSDDMEVFLDADHSGGSYDSASAHAQQYVLSSATTTGCVLLTLASTNPALSSPALETESAVRTEGATCVYEVSLPGWNAIGGSGDMTRHVFVKGQVIGLNIGFGDFDTQENADAVACLYSAYSILDGRADCYRNADALLEFELQGPSVDFDGNGILDFQDFFSFADAYGAHADGARDRYDLNVDGVIDFEDFFLFADSFGGKIPSTFSKAD